MVNQFKVQHLHRINVVVVCIVHVVVPKLEATLAVKAKVLQIP